MVSQLMDILTPAGVYKGQENLDAMMAQWLTSKVSKDTILRQEAAIHLKAVLESVAQDLREALAERLLLEEKIPPQLYLALAHDTSVIVARPILEKVTCFEDSDWGFVIEHTSSDHWHVVASRGDLSTNTLLKLLETEEEKTVLSIVDNKSVSLDQSMLSRLKEMSFKFQSLHMPLSLRSKGDQNLVAELYWTASQIVREELMQKYVLDRVLLDDALERLLQEFVDGMNGSSEVNETILSLAKRYASVHEVTSYYLGKVLKRGQLSYFIALFAEKAGLSVSVIQRCVYQKSGKPLAALCKANGVMRSEFATFYLMLRDCYNENGVDLLPKALGYFDELGREQSKRMLFDLRFAPSLV